MPAFWNVRPLQKGRIGHPQSGGGRKMYDCVGVQFIERPGDVQWTLRLYADMAGFIWTRARPRPPSARNKPTGWYPLEIVSEDEVPEPVVLFAKAELVRLRLLRKIQA